MLNLYRFITFDDVEDVLLQDRSKYAEYDEGVWLSPVGNAAQEWTMSASASVSSDDATRLAKLLWMEKGRTDARAVGKMSVIRGGGIRGKTDKFIAAESGSMTLGKQLTLKQAANGEVVLGLAGAGDIVKAVVFMAPGNDADGYLHFELVD